MSSQTQIEANRRNAQSSTGPRTPEGKAAVSMNALKHGLRSQIFRANYRTNPEGFDEILANLIAECQPQTFLEEVYVERMAIALAKLTWFEDAQRNHRGVTSGDHSTITWWKQEAQLERAFDRALDRFRMLRKERLAAAVAAAAASRSLRSMRKRSRARSKARSS